MRTAAALPVCLGLILTACGAASPIFTPGATPPVFSPAAAASGTPGATPAGTAPASAPAATADAVAGFDTLAAAHDYAARQGAAHLQAALVTDPSQCPTQQGAVCYVENTKVTTGTDAAYFQDDISFNPSGAADIVYLYHDTAGWHWLNSLGTQAEFPSVGATVVVQIDSGCANVRASASTASAVVTCLKNQSEVTISQGPVWADGHMWWYLSDRHGWIIHDSLIQGFAPQTQL